MSYKSACCSSTSIVIELKMIDSVVKGKKSNLFDKILNKIHNIRLRKEIFISKRLTFPRTAKSNYMLIIIFLDLHCFKIRAGANKRLYVPNMIQLPDFPVMIFSVFRPGAFHAII